MAEEYRLDNVILIYSSIIEGKDILRQKLQSYSLSWILTYRSFFIYNWNIITLQLTDI